MAGNQIPGILRNSRAQIVGEIHQEERFSVGSLRGDDGKAVGQHTDGVGVIAGVHKLVEGAQRSRLFPDLPRPAYDQRFSIGFVHPVQQAAVRFSFKLHIVM
jgi:hypothetical protein